MTAVITMTEFVRPELNDARDVWVATTGLTVNSPEWGEVSAVMYDCGLLEADRHPAPTLFDELGAELGAEQAQQAAAVLRARLALMVSARLASREVEFPMSHATALEVTVVLLDAVYRDLALWEFDHAEVRLADEIAARVLVVVDSPAEALNHLLVRLGEFPQVPQPVSRLLLHAARSNDEVALAVFTALPQVAVGSQYRVAVERLCDGGWVLYSTDCIGA